MHYTPVELRHVRLSRALFGGYKRAEADVLLSDVADSFEDVWRERGELADRLEDVEKRLEEIKQRESLLATTLVAAEKTAAEAVESAKRKAEIIVAEAHQESRSITRTAQNERERLFAEARRVETLLRAALGIVEETSTGEAASAEASGSGSSSWPNRENTSEFAAVSEEDAASVQLPPPQATDDDSGPDVPWSGRDFAWG
jgi:cell division septum initiation protein DivIVA